MSTSKSQRKPSTKQTRPKAAAKARPTVDEAVASAPKRRILPWIFCLGIAALHAGLSPAVASSLPTGDTVTLYVWLMVPAWFTIVFLPGARQTGYHRWLTVLILANIVEADYMLATLTVAHAWVLHRFWVVDYPGTSTFHAWIAKGTEIQRRADEQVAAKRR